MAVSVYLRCAERGAQWPVLSLELSRTQHAGAGAETSGRQRVHGASAPLQVSKGVVMCCDARISPKNVQIRPLRVLSVAVGVAVPRPRQANSAVSQNGDCRGGARGRTHVVAALTLLPTAVSWISVVIEIIRRGLST